MVDAFVEREIFDLRPENGLGLTQPSHKAIGERFGERLLIGKELIHRANWHAGAGGDQVGTGRIESDFGEDLRRGIKDCLDDLLVAEVVSYASTCRAISSLRGRPKA